MHYIELGRIYAQMGRKEEARKYIHKGLAMPEQEKDDPEMKEIGRRDVEKNGVQRAVIVAPDQVLQAFCRSRTTPAYPPGRHP